MLQLLRTNNKITHSEAQHIDKEHKCNQVFIPPGANRCQTQPRKGESHQWSDNV